MCGDVALAVLANLVRVIRLRAAGVPLDLDNGLPVGTGLRHGPTLKPLRRFLCLAPSGSYVLNHHTTVSAMCDVARHRNIANPRGGQFLGWGSSSGSGKALPQSALVTYVVIARWQHLILG